MSKKKVFIDAEKIKRVSELREVGANWKTIAAAIGVDPATLRNWRKQGAIDVDNLTISIFAELARAISQAETNRFESLAKTVHDTATRKRHRVKKRTQQNADGTVNEITEVTILGPDANLALQILLRENWKIDDDDESLEPTEAENQDLDLLEIGDAPDAFKEDREDTETET